MNAARERGTKLFKLGVELFVRGKSVMEVRSFQGCWEIVFQAAIVASKPIPRRRIETIWYPDVHTGALQPRADPEDLNHVPVLCRGIEKWKRMQRLCSVSFFEGKLVYRCFPFLRGTSMEQVTATHTHDRYAVSLFTR